jgi:hypothetical protein
MAISAAVSMGLKIAFKAPGSWRVLKPAEGRALFWSVHSLRFAIAVVFAYSVGYSFLIDPVLTA